jgi:YHS domain-containing protein
MFRFLLLTLLLILLIRAGWQLLFGVLQGFATASAPPSSRAPLQGVSMVRDPVCGTFVVRDRAVVLRDGDPVYFCSTACRDKYRPAHVKGRTA